MSAEERRTTMSGPRSKAFNIDDLILRIHGGSLEPSSWPGVVESLRIAVGARGALLHTSQVRSLEDYWYFNAQFDPSELETYARDWMTYDVWADGARTRGLYSQEGRTYVDDVLVERRTFRQSGFFCDFLRRNDIDRMATMNLHRNGIQGSPIHTQLSVFSGLGQDPFSKRHVELLEHLKPHLLVAIRNYCSLRSLRAVNATTEVALNDVAAALVAVDRKGELVHSNRLGEEVVRDGTWLSSVGNKVVPGRELANTRACWAAIRGVIAGTGATLMLELTTTRAQRVLLATPVDRSGPARIPVPPSATGLLWLLGERPGANAIERVARLFDLTGAETRLLAQLADSVELRSAAVALGISVHTARNQLKALSRKTGLRRQADLLALLNRLAAIVGARAPTG